MNATAALFVKSLLIGIDSAASGNRFADGEVADIAELPFEEAVLYLKKKEVLPAAEYYKLSDKARFRAFTVSRLADGDMVERVKGLLAQNLEDGSGLKGFLEKTDTEIMNGLGLGGNGGGWYWENVYRTNVQTAYNAGRALGFEAVKPIALELVGIGDMRQTEICRSLTQPPVRKMYDDPFWKTHWPPFHFGCRTTIRAIYDPAELEEEPITVVVPEEKPAQGFGTYPITSGNWWRELASMTKRAKKYGIQGEIEKAKKILIGGEERGKEDQEIQDLADFEFLFKDIREENRQAVVGDLQKISSTQLTFLLKHGKSMRGDFYGKPGSAYYSSATNRIYLNILSKDARSDALGYAVNTTTLLHEWGHWLDWNLIRDGKTLRQQLPNLREFLRKDVFNYINRLINLKKKIKSIKGIMDLSSDERLKIYFDLAENGSLKNGVSDIFSGLTQDKIKGMYHHPATYWKGDHLESEALALFFEARSPGGDKLELLKSSFPSAVA